MYFVLIFDNAGALDDFSREEQDEETEQGECGGKRPAKDQSAPTKGDAGASQGKEGVQFTLMNIYTCIFFPILIDRY